MLENKLEKYMKFISHKKSKPFMRNTNSDELEIKKVGKKILVLKTIYFFSISKEKSLFYFF